jgi:branched-chain amino acid transport system substrate-binding protein
MKTRSRGFILIPILVLSLLPLFLMGGRREAQLVRVGMIAMLTGPYTDTDGGNRMINGGRLAVSEINQSGGLMVNGRKREVLLLIEDDGGTPEGAILAARKLIYQDGVVALIGPQFSGNAIPAGLVADQAGVVMICPISTHPDTTAGRRFVFRIPFLNTFQGWVIARFAYVQLKARRSAVLYDVANAYNRALAESFIESFENEGGRVVSTEIYTSDQNTDFRLQLERIAESHPDVLFLPNYAADALLQARQARELGLECTFLGGDGWSAETFSKEEAFRGAYMISHYHPSLDTETASQFFSDYRAAFEEIPNDLAATTYDACNVLFTAIDRAGETGGEAVRESLFRLGPFEGVTGTVEYRNTGDPKKSAIITRIDDGETVVIDIIKDNTP